MFKICCEVYRLEKAFKKLPIVKIFLPKYATIKNFEGQH